jgi:hypothetical protein
MKQDDRKPEDTVMLNGIPYTGNAVISGKQKELAPSVEMADGSVCPWYCNAATSKRPCRHLRCL